MFDLIAGKLDRPLHDSRRGPAFVSAAAHVFVLAAVLVPLLYATGQLPRVQHAPDMMAFVVNEMPAAPPPPRVLPPSPPPERQPPRAEKPAPPVPVVSPPVSPVENAPVAAPAAIAPEKEGAVATAGAALPRGEGDSVVAGVPGGIAGIAAEALSPPPPAKPVRIGGAVAAPKLIRQVPPVYPPLAAHAQIAAVVILEATVGTDGLVQSVRVLQGNPMLDQAAIDAVKQWQYTPVVVNGVPTPFILTLTVNFRLSHQQS